MNTKPKPDAPPSPAAPCGFAKRRSAGLWPPSSSLTRPARGAQPSPPFFRLQPLDRSGLIRLNPGQSDLKHVMNPSQIRKNRTSSPFQVSRIGKCPSVQVWRRRIVTCTRRCEPIWSRFDADLAPPAFFHKRSVAIIPAGRIAIEESQPK